MALPFISDYRVHYLVNGIKLSSNLEQYSYKMEKYLQPKISKNSEKASNTTIFVTETNVAFIFLTVIYDVCFSCNFGAVVGNISILYTSILSS